LLGRYQFKEALTSFLLHHAAPETAYPAAPASDRPNHAHLRRPVYVDVINSTKTIKSGVGSVSAPIPVEKRLGKEAHLAPGELEKGVREKLQDQLKIQAKPGEVEGLTKQGYSSKRPSARTVLLEKQVITPPDWETWNSRTEKGSKKVYRPLGSAEPDFLVLKPRKSEVFEVTLDAKFTIKPQLQGMHVKGEKRGDPHKIIQLSKVRYLAQRYPGVPIVYNIQTSGQPLTDDVKALLSTALWELAREMNKLGLTNPIQIVWRI
jgi:hypothetical protein